MLLNYIRNSLLIKKFIEADEFDNGIRNIFNYGTVWSCNESEINFSIPHGIAVSIGMDMANYIAFSNGILPDKCIACIHYYLRITRILGVKFLLKI